MSLAVHAKAPPIFIGFVCVLSAASKYSISFSTKYTVIALNVHNASCIHTYPCCLHHRLWFLRWRIFQNSLHQIKGGRAFGLGQGCPLIDSCSGALTEWHTEHSSALYRFNVVHLTQPQCDLIETGCFQTFAASRSGDTQIGAIRAEAVRSVGR